MGRSLNVTVPWFLCTSLLYYRHEIGVLSDTAFDKMCAVMLANWGKIKHPHKAFIKRSHLTAGTGFDLPWHRLPSSVVGAAGQMAVEWSLLQAP
jgi:hypothetical protein